MKFFIKKVNNLSSSAKIMRLAFFWMLTFTLLGANDIFAENSKEKSCDETHLTARDVFTKLECPALEILPLSRRLDMLDYWDTDSIYKASNVMEGLSWLEAMTDDYLKVHITNVSNLEIKILPDKKSELVMTVYTIGSDSQAQDSQIDFYDCNLTKLETGKYFEMPDLKNFFEIPKGSITSMKEIKDMIPFPTMAFSISEKGYFLTARLTVEDYMNVDDWNIIRLFLKPSIESEWKKEKFKF